MLLKSGKGADQATALFERADGWLKRWEEYFLGVSHGIWYGGHNGEPLAQWTWAVGPLARVERVFTRGRALLHLARERGADADVGITMFPESFDTWLYERGFEWEHRRELGRALYCVKAAICVAAGLHGHGDHDSTVSEMAAWDVGTAYESYESHGTTLEVGRGLFRNWWYGLGSL